jgi:methionyl aminopeptidase
MDNKKILEAGEIASKTVKYAKEIIKKDVPLIEIAEKIEEKIVELGGKPAFPTNLSIDDIAAHYTPTYNDETKAHGLLKIDLGVHVNGFVADTAFSVDLENSEENKKLIETAEQTLENAIKITKKGTKLNEIGKTIQETIESEDFSPIINLSGHSIEEYDLHAGITIPNHDNGNTEELDKGLIAIEPFVTTGSGKVYDGKPSGIYHLIDEKTPRTTIARKVLNFIQQEYKSLPFCQRWLVNNFGTKALFAIKQLEDNGNLHNYPQLIEASHKPVAQAEHTLLIDDEVIITTK